MIYLIAGILICIWYAIAGFVVVFKERLKYLLVGTPTVMLAVFLYEASDSINWAYGVIALTVGLGVYEVSKLTARHYKARRPARHVTTEEFMRDLPGRDVYDSYVRNWHSDL